jgi:hypothetical protein
LHHTYLTKALITMIIIYLCYIRDQLFQIFYDIDTVGIFISIIFPHTCFLYVLRSSVRIVTVMMYYRWVCFKIRCFVELINLFFTRHMKKIKVCSFIEKMLERKCYVEFCGRSFFYVSNVLIGDPWKEK